MVCNACVCSQDGNVTITVIDIVTNKTNRRTLVSIDGTEVKAAPKVYNMIRISPCYKTKEQILCLGRYDHLTCVSSTTAKWRRQHAGATKATTGQLKAAQQAHTAARHGAVPVTKKGRWCVCLCLSVVGVSLKVA